MKRKALALLLIGGAVLLAGCGALPVTVDLLPALQSSGSASGSLSQPLNLPPGSELGDLEGKTLWLPDQEGLAVSYEVPALPAEPASLEFDYAVRLDYAVTCVDGLRGQATASLYLSGESPPWDAPLEGAEASVALKPEGSLRLEGHTSLTPEQIDAVLSGKVVLGLRLEFRDLEGTVSESCTPEIEGAYQIERAVLKIRFL